MKDKHINYIELKANNLDKVKSFYSYCFDWEFKDYGPNYTAFSNSGLEGGFEKSEETIVNGALVVLYFKNLKQIQEKVEEAGGRITKNIFSFPGGSRFQFKDPSGNELAVWSENE